MACEVKHEHTMHAWLLIPLQVNVFYNIIQYNNFKNRFHD